MLAENKDNLLIKNKKQVLDKEIEQKRILNNLETIDTCLLQLGKLNAEREHLFEEEYQYVSGGRYQQKFEQKTSHYNEVVTSLKKKLNQSVEELEENHLALTKEIQLLETENDQIRREMTETHD
ncbi:hypothetical protein A5881_001554 [Enterococcus termitis]|nr:hypothetical protein A5881_002125 [Enterococcus termitis]